MENCMHVFKPSTEGWLGKYENNTFENLLKFFPEAINVTSKDLRGFDNRIYRYLKNKSGNSCYSSLSVALEFNVFNFGYNKKASKF